MDIITILGIALWTLIPGFIAKRKGRNFWGYYFLSFLITPIFTTIIVICLNSIFDESNNDDLNNKEQNNILIDSEMIETSVKKR